VKKEEQTRYFIKTSHCTISITTLLSKAHSAHYMPQWNGKVASALANKDIKGV